MPLRFLTSLHMFLLIRFLSLLSFLLNLCLQTYTVYVHTNSFHVAHKNILHLFHPILSISCTVRFLNYFLCSLSMHCWSAHHHRESWLAIHSGFNGYDANRRPVWCPVAWTCSLGRWLSCLYMPQLALRQVRAAETGPESANVPQGVP